MKLLFVAAVSVFIAACSSGEHSASNSSATKAPDPKIERLKKQRDAITQFYKPMQIRDGDWLSSQHESGQTFEEYFASDPTLPTAERRTLYIQPIGNFTAEQKRVIAQAADFLHAFYNLPVKLLPDTPLGTVPKEKQRLIEFNDNRQILTDYFLSDVLPPLLPNDAAAFIAFTNFDLYPGDTWHFVFGQASLENRVGVWSLYRLSDLTFEKDSAADRLLTRTLKISAHEVGHMFGMRHCIKYECLMSGTNHLAETDRRPLDNCPECMAKLSWAMNYDAAQRYKNLAAFWKKNKKPDEEKRILELEKSVALSGAN